jgi:hypothetical protein
VLRYNPATDLWDTVASGYTPRKNHGVAVANGKIYVMGGTDSSGKLVTSIEEYDPETDIWNVKEPMPFEVSQFGITSNNNKIYIIGGQENNHFKEYDPETQTWTDKGVYAFNAARHRAEFVDNSIYVIGGLYWLDCPLVLDSVYSTDDFATALSIGSSVMEPKAGSKNIPVTVSNVPEEGICKLSAVVQYDKTKLSVTNVTAGTIIPEGDQLSYSVDHDNGKVTLTFTGDTSFYKIIKTNGVFANIEFDVPDSVSKTGSTPLTLVKESCSIYKSETCRYSGFKLNNGAVDIFKFGDVDGSSTVTIDDVNKVKNLILDTSYIFPYEYGRLAADVNGDGKINTFDAAYIIKYVNGVIDKFPVQN